MDRLPQRTALQVVSDLAGSTLPAPRAQRIETPGQVHWELDVHPSLLGVLYLWIYNRLVYQTIQFQEGRVQSKPFYASKTLWTNVIGFAWTFIGPVIGVPTLSPELMVGILAVLNVLIRLITHQAVSISGE